MARPPRISVGGIAYHVLNRANGRAKIFHRDEDYAAFERILAEAIHRIDIRLCAYCIMPNHWHLLVWPGENDQLSDFVGWLTLTHAHRWHAHRGSRGTGHLYQDRFKSFPVEGDEHFLAVARYVESNALRARMVDRAEDWRWGSAHHRLRATGSENVLSAWPMAMPDHWVALVNAPIPAGVLNAIKISTARGRPFGREGWQNEISSQLGLQSTMRSRGRPRVVIS